MGNAKKVVIVVNRDSFFLTHRLPLALALKKEGYDVTILAGDTGRAKDIRVAGLNFVALPVVRRSLNPFKELKTFLFIFNFYRKFKPDLVHHVTPKPLFYGSLAARLLGNIPTINAVVGLGSSLNAKKTFHPIQVLVRSMYRLSLSHPKSRNIFMNQDDLNAFQKLKIISDTKKSLIIRGSGVDIGRFKFSSESKESLIVMFASRILFDKGIWEFLQAAKKLRPDFPNVRFVVVGDRDEGNPSAPSLKLLEEWKKDKDFEFWGHQDDMPSVLAKAHVVVLPTYFEGLPKALLEAAACGKPIVATNVPGCRECVIPNVNGFLVPAQEVEKLTEAIATLLKSPDLREKFGRAGRKLVEDQFCVEMVVEKTLQVYSDVVNLQIA